MDLMVTLLISNIICLICFLFLLINYKVIEQKLKEKRQDLENLNSIRMKHLSQLSHDLRTPLNVIMGYTSLLSNKIHGEINAKQKRDLDRISENSKKLLKIMEDFFVQNN